MKANLNNIRSTVVEAEQLICNTSTTAEFVQRSGRDGDGAERTVKFIAISVVVVAL